MSALRSTDVSVRKSPSVSATIYPKGYRMRGNDGNMWVIIIDSRGTHRWSKEHELSFIDKTKLSIDGMRYIMQEPDDPEIIESIKYKLDKKINSLEILAEDGDEEAKQALNLYKKFKVETFRYGGKVAKVDKSISLYKKALQQTNNNQTKRLLEKKISELENQKI
jgi:hypothetical protein